MTSLSTLPPEVVITIMEYIVLNHGPLPLLHFLKALSQYAHLVQVVYCSGDDLSPLGITTSDSDTLLELMTELVDTPFNMLQAPVKDKQKVLKVFNTAKPYAQLRVFLLPNCDHHMTPWSQESFPSSLFASLISRCDIVLTRSCEVVVNSRYDQHEDDVYHTKGFNILQSWCNVVSTTLRDYRHTPQALPVRDLIALQYDAPETDINNDDELSSSRFTQNIIDPTQECLIVKGYRNFRLSAPHCKTLKIIFPSWCFRSPDPNDIEHDSCPSQTAVLLDSPLRTLNIEFSCCGFPTLSNILPFEHSELEVIVNNLNWSRDNPYGKRVCDLITQYGHRCQADWIGVWNMYDLIFGLYSTVSLIGAPDAVLQFTIWTATEKLVWKRLHSTTPLHFNQCVHFSEKLGELTIESINNLVDHQSFKMCAPSLTTLAIIMLPGSTLMWDLMTLLFTDKRGYTGELKNLVLEFQGDRKIGLTRKDLLPVQYWIESLSIKGQIDNLFLKKSRRTKGRSSKSSKHRFRYKLRYLKQLRIDSSIIAPPDGIIFLATDYLPQLRRLVLESSSETTKGMYTLMDSQYARQTILISRFITPECPLDIFLDNTVARKYAITTGEDHGTLDTTPFITEKGINFGDLQQYYFGRWNWTPDSELKYTYSGTVDKYFFL